MLSVRDFNYTPKCCVHAIAALSFLRFLVLTSSLKTLITSSNVFVAVILRYHFTLVN